MQINQDFIGKFVTLLVMLVVLVTAGTPAALPGLAQDSTDARPETEEAAAPQSPGDPYTFTGAPGEPQGHLGYDKDAGQYLPDPTITLNPPSTAEDLALMQTQAAEKMAVTDLTEIRFRSGFEIHPQVGIAAEALAKLSLRSEVAGAEGFYVVQFNYPVPTQARRDLEASGITFYDDLDTAAVLAKIPSHSLNDLQQKVEEGTVRYVGLIPAEARIHPDLTNLAASASDGSSDIVLLTFDAPVQAQLDELGQWFKIERRSDGPMHILEGKVQHAGLQSMAGLEYVRWMEPETINELGNLEGGMAMGADITRGGGWDGTGINVSVIDTGIARSASDAYHPDLLSGRILDQWDYQNNDSNAADDYNHGTHVAGSIGGKYNPGDAKSEQAFQGVAPDASFYIYKLCCGTSQFSFVWFQQALERGTSGGRVTHISNNSWGGGSGVYTTASEIADRAVRGEYNGIPINMVAISHNDNALTRAPGTAKNAITVGAVKDGNWPYTPITTCNGVSDYNWPPAGRVCFSNFGPLDTDGDGQQRIKPDIMATGDMIRSAAPWYLFGTNLYYDYMVGTSPSAAHVTGVIAQFLEHYPTLKTWPEIVKAFMLVTAMDVGNDVNKYGRGLLDAYHMNGYQDSIQDQSHWWGDTITSTQQSIDFNFIVSPGYKEVVVALTWSDPAGPTEGINDLDIAFVKDGSGTVRGSSSSLDDNVEFVRIPSGYASGVWTIRVYGSSVASPQIFGLAANPILAPADLSINGVVEYTGSPSFAVNPGNYVYFHQYVSNSGYAAGGTYARLLVPSGFTVEGARIYTDDGYSYYYDDSQLYYPGGSYWRAALGATIAGSTRHVRWFLRANPGAACGSYTFSNDAYWTQAGVLAGSPSNSNIVNITCYEFEPLIYRK